MLRRVVRCSAISSTRLVLSFHDCPASRPDLLQHISHAMHASDLGQSLPTRRPRAGQDPRPPTSERTEIHFAEQRSALQGQFIAEALPESPGTFLSYMSGIGGPPRADTIDLPLVLIDPAAKVCSRNKGPGWRSSRAAPRCGGLARTWSSLRSPRPPRGDGFRDEAVAVLLG